ncbi:hypothetical protein Leryth_027403 [Lithospermum erythrorhizon]|nr:hypothetical protein Leryth_027403 [Lithospermum erythrorhizon]
MLLRQARGILKISKGLQYNKILNLSLSNFKSLFYSTESDYICFTNKQNKSEKKPWVTNINELKRRARLEKAERRIVSESTLSSPENGLLVEELIPVAHDVVAARNELYTCASRVAESIPIYSCRLCGKVHVGSSPHKIRSCDVGGRIKEHSWEKGAIEHVLPMVESFHLYDRIGRAVSHNERLLVDRIPAVLELCIQAGVDMPEYLTRRREFPVYRVAGKVIDFEKRFPKTDTIGNDITPQGFWGTRKKSRKVVDVLHVPPFHDIKGFASHGLDAWEKLRSGATKLMQKYPVQTCGYCPEVQVGPKGHRVRQCQAFKHQMRDGQHGWQKATIDDLVPPVYVYHIRDPSKPLLDSLKRYYGKLPAVVELFAQAGVQVGESYSRLMRDDVAVPEPEEERLVV